MTDHFNKLKPEQIQLLQKAGAHKSEGWNNREYQAAFLAYHETLKGDQITKNKFDALVRYWDLESQNKRNWNHSKSRGGFSRVPNKMMSGKHQMEKSFSDNREEYLDSVRNKAVQSPAEAESRHELKAIYKGKIYKVKSSLMEAS